MVDMSEDVHATASQGRKHDEAKSNKIRCQPVRYRKGFKELMQV